MNFNDNKDWPNPGVYRGIAYTQYATLQAINATLLKALAQLPPAKALYKVQNQKMTPDIWAGIVMHSFMLDTPETFQRLYPLAAPCGSLLKSGENKGQPCGAGTTKFIESGWRCGQHGGKNGRDGVSQELMGIIEAVHPEIWRVAEAQMNYPESELTLIWEDEDTGLLCKARLDLCDPQARNIADLKKSRHADADWFGGAVGTFGYHIQDAWYRRGAESCMDGGIWNFDFVVVELNKGEKNGVQVLTLDDEAKRVGEATMQSALDVAAMCMEKNVWPMYSTERKIVKMRPWMVRAEDSLNG